MNRNALTYVCSFHLTNAMVWMGEKEWKINAEYLHGCTIMVQTIWKKAISSIKLFIISVFCTLHAYIIWFHIHFSFARIKIVFSTFRIFANAFSLFRFFCSCYPCSLCLYCIVVYAFWLSKDARLSCMHIVFDQKLRRTHIKTGKSLVL